MSDLYIGCASGVLFGIPAGMLLGAGLAVYALWRLFDQGHVRRITIEPEQVRQDRPAPGVRPES